MNEFLLVLYLTGYPLAFVIGWLCYIAAKACSACIKGEPIKPAIQPLLDEW